MVDMQEIEITPEMIEAGEEILWGFDRDRDSPKPYVARMFTAMARFYRPEQLRTP
jgi:hypothetical protein